jgi:hypothetical protein
VERVTQVFREYYYPDDHWDDEVVQVDSEASNEIVDKGAEELYVSAAQVCRNHSCSVT